MQTAPPPPVLVKTRPDEPSCALCREPLLSPLNIVVRGLGSRDGHTWGSHLSQVRQLLFPSEGEAIMPSSRGCCGNRENHTRDEMY